MSTRSTPSFRRVAALALAGTLMSACGEGVICLNGGSCENAGGGNDIVVGGDVASVVVDNSLRDLVVFVYTDIQSDPDRFPAGPRIPEDLACLTAANFAGMRTVVVSGSASSTRTFSIQNILRGELTVVFLQDQSTDPDGQIDIDDVAGGPASCDCVEPPPACPANDIPASDNAVAELDGEGRLNNVRAGQSVDLDTITIDFPTAAATADQISITASSGGDGSDGSSSALGTGGGLTIGFASR